MMNMTLMLSERAAGEDNFDELLDWMVHRDCTDSRICRKNGIS